MNNPKISVIVPTYAQTELFKKAIYSIKNQTYNNFEIIVVDDNTDENISFFVRNIVSELMVDIKYHKNEMNIGSVASRNKGISLADGDIITFLDDDDIYVKDKLSRQLKSLIENDANFSVCNISFIYANGKEIKRNRLYMGRNEPLLTQHLKYHIAGTSCLMYESNFLRKIGGFSISDFGDDYYLVEKSILNSSQFIHSDFVGVNAFIDGDVGLSSWKNKIKLEKELILHKSKYFSQLSQLDVNYIKMRHNLVLSLAYLRGKRFFYSFVLLVKSFLYQPMGFLNIILKKDL